MIVTVKVQLVLALEVGRDHLLECPRITRTQKRWLCFGVSGNWLIFIDGVNVGSMEYRGHSTRVLALNLSVCGLVYGV